jgi:hypothetical protein
MISSANMTETISLWRKQTAGVTPEGWEQVGGLRRAQITRTSDEAGLNEAARWNANVTHYATVLYADDYETEAKHGSRVVKRESDGTNYTIERVVGEGLRQRGGRTKYLRLSLSEKAPAEV